jgi:hypothetical protein
MACNHRWSPAGLGCDICLFCGKLRDSPEPPPIRPKDETALWVILGPPIAVIFLVVTFALWTA